TAHVTTVGAVLEVPAGPAGEYVCHRGVSVVNGVTHVAGPHDDGLVPQRSSAVRGRQRLELLDDLDELAAQPTFQLNEFGALVGVVQELVVPFTLDVGGVHGRHLVVAKLHRCHAREVAGKSVGGKVQHGCAVHQDLARG